MPEPVAGVKPVTVAEPAEASILDYEFSIEESGTGHYNDCITLYFYKCYANSECQVV